MRIPVWFWTFAAVCHGAFALWAVIAGGLGDKLVNLTLIDILALGFLGTLTALPKLTGKIRFQNDAVHYLVAAAVFVFFGLIAISLAYLAGNTAGATIAAGLFATLGWIYSNYNTNKNQRVNHTISILLQMRNSAEYMKHRKAVFERFPTQEIIELTDARELVRGETPASRETSDSLTYVLNYFEFISVNVIQGNLDDTIIDSTIGGIIVNIYDFAQPFIATSRDDDWGRPNRRLWVFLQQLAEEYRRRRAGGATTALAD